MKRTKIRRVSKAPISKLQRDLWAIIRQIVFKLYGTDCYTCDQRNLQGINLQCGHVPWPKSILPASLKYDVRMLRSQCFGCNINKGGNGGVAYARMLREIGSEGMALLEIERQKLVKADRFFYENKIKEATELLSSL